MQMLSHPSAYDESAEEKQADEVMQISTNTTAGDVFDRLSRHMRLVFFQHLLACGECNTGKILEILANTVMQSCSVETTQTTQAGATEMRLCRSRHMTPKALERAAVQKESNRRMIAGMVIPVPPDDEHRWQEEAASDARAKIEEALHNIEAVGMELCHVRRAHDIMSDRTRPDSMLSVQRLAKHAAQAQELLNELLNSGSLLEPKDAKLAERTVRDIVMLCCRAQAGIKDRKDFLTRAAQAYGVPQLSLNVTAQLMLSYSKNDKNKQCGFASNNAYTNNRNGPRPGRNREFDDTYLANTSGSVCTAAVSMSVEKTINQDHQQGKDEHKSEFGEAMSANQEASCQANDEWNPNANYATSGQLHLADQISDIQCPDAESMHPQQLAAFHLQAQHWHMEQSEWYANEYQKRIEERVLTFWVVESKTMPDTPACYATPSVLS